MLQAESTTRETNCIGTVLYVMGIIDEDKYIWRNYKKWRKNIIDKFLEQLVRIEQPEKGAIFVIRNIEHRV